MFAQKTIQTFILYNNLDKILLFSSLRKKNLQNHQQLLVNRYSSLNSKTLTTKNNSLDIKVITSAITTTKKLGTIATVNYIHYNNLFITFSRGQGVYYTQPQPSCYNSNNFFKSFKRNYSRFSASTIMPHNTFNLNNYDIIGFDLDGTLLRYNLDAMVSMEYDVIAKYLIENKNYPVELLKPIDDSIDFLQKGLILDAEHGNILKLTSDGVIGKATHGTKLLSDNDIKKIYGEEKKWDLAIKYINDPLSAWNGPDAEKLRALLDYFDMPASLVMARAVDLIYQKYDINNLPIYKIWPDILYALVYMYKREHFVSGTSEYFEELKEFPSKYIHKSDPFIIEWLKELKKTKAIFLLTGSNIDFAHLTASHALGHNWRDLFDVVIAFAKKPGFFNMDRSFYNFQGGEEYEIVPDDSIKMGNVYAQGNWRSLEKLLSKNGKTIKKPRSLYFGDNLIQDVYTPSKYCNLDTVSLVEELEEHECQDGYAFKKVIQSHFWDSYFSVDNKPTYWSEIIALHSKMCLPTVDHLCKHPIDYEYERANTLIDLCSSKIED